MNPWIGYPATVLVTFILSYAFHGTWKLLVRKLKAPLYQHLNDVKTQLETAVGKEEVAFKAEVQKVIAKIEKVLP